jgi:hypothetical protein
MVKNDKFQQKKFASWPSKINRKARVTSQWFEMQTTLKQAKKESYA